MIKWRLNFLVLNNVSSTDHFENYLATYDFFKNKYNQIRI